MKNIFKIIIFSIAASFCLSSCITSKDTNLLQDIKKDYSTIPPPDEYRIIPGDVLQIAVYIWEEEQQPGTESGITTKQLFEGFTPHFVGTREGDLSTSGGGSWGGWGGGSSATEEGTQGSTPIVVYADGTINFPHLGRIYVADLTLLETRKLITSRLQEIDTEASVNVTLRNNFFSVIGESGARRVDMRSTNMTIYQALATAGNISDYSKRNNVTILRQINGGTQVKTFDLRSKDIVNTEFYYIQPNDVIYFPQAKTKFFGATSSFLGIFGLVTSFASIVVMALKIF